MNFRENTMPSGYPFAILLLGLIAPAAHAAEVAKRPLVFAISEGSSGGIDAEAARAKYQPLADALGRAISADIKVSFVREFAALERGMKYNQYDLVIARPSDYPARGLRDYQYRFVSTIKPDGQCALIVHKDSTLRKVADLKGKSFVMPEKDAYMTRFCRAELRDQGVFLENESVHYVREQGAIPFGIENKISDVGGIASYSGAYAKLAKSDFRVLHLSKPQPYMPMVASRNLTVEQVERLQGALTELSQSDAGKDILKRLGATGFVTTEEARLRKLLEWLGV
jgi:ABC-type phosphate/phosphonate transport system substrate-binding protein